MDLAQTSHWSVECFLHEIENNVFTYSINNVKERTRSSEAVDIATQSVRALL